MVSGAGALAAGEGRRLGGLAAAGSRVCVAPGARACSAGTGAAVLGGAFNQTLTLVLILLLLFVFVLEEFELVQHGVLVTGRRLGRSVALGRGGRAGGASTGSVRLLVGKGLASGVGDSTSDGSRYGRV